jgi:hypothetical protein
VVWLLDDDLLFDEEEPPTSVEMAVLRALKMGLLARQIWEAERDEGEPPPPEGQIVLQSSIAFLRCQAAIIANLAVVPETRAELKAKMPDTVEYVPMWMEARVFGVETMTSRLYACGMCHVLRQHREAIERIIEEQVSEPEPLEEMLEEAPIPPATDDEGGSEILSGGTEAVNAHMKVLVDIAHDLDKMLLE